MSGARNDGEAPGPATAEASIQSQGHDQGIDSDTDRPAGGGKERIDRIVETAIYLQAESRRLAREQCARHGITATQLNVLKLLLTAGELSLSELSRRLAANNSTVTGIIDRMVGADLVMREQRATDRRVWIIRATERGRELATRVDVAPWDLLRSALDALPGAELAALIDTLTKLAVHVTSAVAAADEQGDKSS